MLKLSGFFLFLLFAFVTRFMASGSELQELTESSKSLLPSGLLKSILRRESTCKLEDVDTHCFGISYPYLAQGSKN